jgi:GNAT superfamily N-acetyltransferase
MKRRLHSLISYPKARTSIVFSKNHLLSISFLLLIIATPGCSKKQTTSNSIPVPQKKENNVIFLEEAASEEEWDGKKIVMKVGKTRVGFINYAQVNSFFNVYALYELYIDPAYRGKGYAKSLINYTCRRLFKMGAAKIFIQPGPFEEEEEEDDLSDEEYKEKLLKIVCLYKSSGFYSAPNWMKTMAKGIYKTMGIIEDPKYLMIRTT